MTSTGWESDERRLTFASSFLRLFGQQNSLDVGQHTTLGDGHTRQKFVQLLVVADGQLEVTRDDSRLLIVACSVACQFQDLGSQVFQHSSQVHGSASTHSLSIVSFPQQTVNTAHWELETSTGGAGLGLSLDFATFASARHDD